MFPTQSDADLMLREYQRERRQETAMTGMTRDEALVRAREAYIAATETPHNLAAIRDGLLDSTTSFTFVVTALLDAHKPLSEIVPQPPVDQDVAMAWEIVAQGWDREGDLASARSVRAGKPDDVDKNRHALALAAIKRGRELASGAA